MLFAINGGRVAGCDLRQEDIVHLETTVERVVATGTPYVFYDRNATLAFSEAFTDVSHLDTAVAWDLFTENPTLDDFCKFWQNVPTNSRYVDRMERRQAEFLAANRVPLDCILRFGTINAAKASEVAEMVRKAGHKISAEAMRDWYF